MELKDLISKLESEDKKFVIEAIENLTDENKWEIIEEFYAIQKISDINSSNLPTMRDALELVGNELEHLSKYNLAPHAKREFDTFMYDLNQLLPKYYITTDEHLSEGLKENQNGFDDIEYLYSDYKMTELSIRLEGITDKDEIVKETLRYVQAEMGNRLTNALEEYSEYIKEWQG